MGGALPVGSKIGKYEIVQHLASGGQSIVYKGYDALLDRHVAIKQIAPFLASDAKFLARFRDVSRLLAKLDCEQVVSIHDLIEDPSGLFVVMEYIEGRTLETILANSPGPMDSKVVLQIIWKVAAGLAALHRAGIIHRDIKPSNIIVGDGMRVKITDFGVAVRSGAPASMKLGTTKYMAPELFGGAESDGRVDIYSLGIVAYEMALGRAKFQEVFADIVRDPYSESLRWMKWHSSADQVAAPLAEVVPGTPAPLSAIVAKMMAKDPARRYQNVEDLGKDIRANFSARAQVPPPPGRRHRRGMTSVGPTLEGEEGGPLSADRGNELTTSPAGAVPSDGPATAEIPKVPMSMGKKLAIVGSIVLVVAVGLLAVYINNSNKEAAVRREASGKLATAMDRFRDSAKINQGEAKKKGFLQAEELFADIAKEYQQSSPARPVVEQAKVMESLSQAFVLTVAGEEGWTEKADSALKNARTRLDDIHRNRKELADWAKDTERTISSFSTFFGQMKACRDALAAMDSAIKLGNFDEAETIIASMATPLPLQEQTARVQEARGQIERMRKVEEFWVHHRAAEALKKQTPVKVPDIIAEYDKALAVLEASKDTLPQDVYNNLFKLATDAKKLFQMKVDYAQAKGEGDRLLAAKSFLGAADAYERAIKIQPSDPDGLKPKVATLRHDYFIDQGKTHLLAGRVGQAEDAFNKAKEYKPNSPEAQTELDKIFKMKALRTVLDQALALYQQKNVPQKTIAGYDAALAKLVDAEKLKPADPEIKEINDLRTKCNYAKVMLQIEIEHSKGDWAKTRQLLNQAKQIDPAQSGTIDSLLDKLKVEEEFDKKFKEYQSALAAKKWQESIALLKEARKIMAKPEIDGLITDATYEMRKADGDKAFAEGDYNSAAAYYNLAKGLKTPAPQEILDRIQKTQEKLGKTTSP